MKCKMQTYFELIIDFEKDYEILLLTLKRIMKCTIDFESNEL